MPDPSKTEQATPKRRRDERKKGNVFSSKDIVSVVSILVGFTFLNIYFTTMIENLNIFTKKYFDFAAEQATITNVFVMNIFFDTLVVCIFILLPVMGVSLISSILATGVQTRFLFSMESLKPKFDKLNPINGLKNIISLKSIVELIKSLIKISVIIAVIYNFFVDKMGEFSRIMYMEIPQAVNVTLTSIMQMVYNICIIFIFVAAFDYFYQRWDYENKLKMSKQEVKEEYKQMEGDPKIKGKIKEQQRKIAMSRMMQQVPGSDVVIRNPTHYAVALRYNIDKDAAPIVVAKGQDNIALRIVKLAQENDIYITENKELARALYSAAEINQSIPYDLYSAVAEILALVYKIKNKQI